MKVAHFDCAKTEVYEQGAVGGGHSILDKTRPRRKHASSRSTTWTFNGPSSSTPTVPPRRFPLQAVNAGRIHGLTHY